MSTVTAHHLAVTITIKILYILFLEPKFGFPAPNRTHVRFCFQNQINSLPESGGNQE